MENELIVIKGTLLIYYYDSSSHDSSSSYDDSYMTHYHYYHHIYVDLDDLVSVTLLHNSFHDDKTISIKSNSKKKSYNSCFFF